MRITLLTQWFHPEPGALRGLPLATWLAGRGHDVRVITGFPNYPTGKVYAGYRLRPLSREVVDGVEVMRVPLYPSHDRSPARRLANYASFAASASTVGLLASPRPDVLYVYHPPPTVGLPAMLWKRFGDVPFAYHIADMWPESVTESGMIASETVRRRVERALSWWCLRVYRSASRVTVLSPGFKRLLVERGVPADKIDVIYNWAEEDVYFPRPRNEALARELGLTAPLTVMYAGNLGRFQRVDTLVHAASRLRDVPGLEVVLVGTGQMEGELRALVDRLGLANVRFLGRREPSEMGEISNLADVLVVSLEDLPFFRSTIPSKTQVAMAMGKPLLAAVAGDAADLVRRAGAGVVCPPGDDAAMAGAIAQLQALGSEELAAMGRRGRDFYVEHLSLEGGAIQTEDVLRRVAAPATATTGTGTATTATR